MTVYDLLQKLELQVDCASNGAREKVLSVDSEVCIEGPDHTMYEILDIDFDCFDLDEPWMLIIRAGEPVFGE